MNDSVGNLDDRELVRTEFLEIFERNRAEHERVAAIVAPLCESIPAFLKTREVLKGEPLTMSEVIDFTVQFLREEKDFVSLCLARAITIHDVIHEIAGCLWLHYQMKDYDYIHIDDDPAFTCSREIEDALRERLEAVGLVGRPN